MRVFSWSGGVLLACLASLLMIGGFSLERLLEPDRFVRAKAPVSRVLMRVRSGFKSGHGWYESVNAGVHAQFIDPLVV
jgi:hypothetical protein